MDPNTQPQIPAEEPEQETTEQSLSTDNFSEPVAQPQVPNDATAGADTNSTDSSVNTMSSENNTPLPSDQSVVSFTTPSSAPDSVPEVITSQIAKKSNTLIWVVLSIVIVLAVGVIIYVNMLG